MKHLFKFRGGEKTLKGILPSSNTHYKLTLLLVNAGRTFGFENNNSNNNKIITF